MSQINKRIIIYASFDEPIEDEKEFTSDLEQAVDEVVQCYNGQVVLIKNGSIVEGDEE